MTEHTPGPWELGELSGFYGQRIECGGTGAGPEILANVNVEFIKEGEANARLIAAAPDLAAVLIEYESIEGEMILDDECWGNELPTRYYDRLIELQHKRNAALEKAGCSLEMRTKAKEG